MIIQISEAARAEYAQAFCYYNDIRPALGKAFEESFELALNRIAEAPSAYPMVRANIRRCNFKRFPYSLIYGASDAMIWVVAVAHHSREPEYWKDRII